MLLLYAYHAIQTYRYSFEFSTAQSDVAIVLGAGSTNGKVSPVFEERCNHAIQLFLDKKVDTIIVTGGYGEGQTTSDSEAGKGYLIASGIPASSILIENQSSNTIENLVYAQKIMKANNLSTALIVSDPLHDRRSIKIAELLGMSVLPSPTPTTMYRSNRTKLNLCLSEARYYIKLIFIDRFFNAYFV